ncbi:MAG: adenosine deaminase [Thermoanaerobaculia bacterium]
MTDGELERLVVALPKVELHVHLEGSMRPPVLLELARRNRVDLPAGDAQQLAEWFRFRDFEHFVDIYLTCSRCLRTPEDFQLLARDFVAEQERQNVLWSEAHFTISTHLSNGVNGDEVADALAEVFDEAARRRGVHVRLIPDIVRNVGPAAADRTLEWALDHRRHGVVALGLSGFESVPDGPFREHFEVAEREGLHRVAHAGEHGGPEVIRSVLDTCRAERIGHGVRAVDDPGLLAELAERGIPLEVCPTSNVRLGVCPELGEHPLPRLRAAGIPVTLNSDDPPLFGTTLNDEYLRVAETFALAPQDLAALATAAFEASFAAGAERQELAGRMRDGLQRAGLRACE